MSGEDPDFAGYLRRIADEEAAALRERGDRRERRAIRAAAAEIACLPSDPRLYGALIQRIRRATGDPQGAFRRCEEDEDHMALHAKELRDKTPDQLRDELAKLKKESFNLRFQQATGQLENTSRMRVVQRDAARVKTILNQKAARAASEA